MNQIDSLVHESGIKIESSGDVWVEIVGSEWLVSLGM